MLKLVAARRGALFNEKAEQAEIDAKRAMVEILMVEFD